MAERVTLTWSFENWLTVVLMVAIMYAAAGVIVSFVRSNLPSGADA